LAAALAVAGYRYVRDLDGVTTEDLLKVPGVGEKTAEKISISVAAVLEVLEEEKQEMLREMEERARAEAMRRAEAQEPRYDAEPSEPGEADAEGEEPEEGAEEGDDAAPADASDEGAVEQGEAAATEGEAQPEER